MRRVPAINMGSERACLSGSVTLQEFDFCGPKKYTRRPVDRRERYAAGPSIADYQDDHRAPLYAIAA